jgi:replicative DNA helicase
MSVDKILARIAKERSTVQKDLYDNEGLLRLQETMAAYDGEYQLVWSDDLLEELKSRPKVEAYNTGVRILDDLTGGFRDKQVITIAAHSKHGKTAFGLFLLEKLTYLNPVMIPLEQSNEELIEQRYENGYSIPRFLSPKSLAARVSTGWIEERVVEGIAKYNTKLVLIDHLGYINDMDGDYKRENHALRIEKMMQDIKNIAKKWNVAIVLLAHIVKADESKPPSLEDLKGSQSILGESDKVIMLWRKNSLQGKVRVYEDKTLISMLANRRNGKNGSIGLAFQGGQYVEDNDWVQSMMDSADLANQLEA